MQIDKKVLICWGEGGCEDKRLLKEYCGKGNTTEDKCSFLFNLPHLSDQAIGGIVLVLGLLIMSLALILVVKVLRSLLEGKVANLLKRFINADIPHVPWLTGYIAIFMGAVLTFAVQSSSVFTSTITPLVGGGLIEVDRMYPLILGSNIGTTSTALLASFATGKRDPLQIALCHFFFNIFGILIFYPIPFMRIPLVLCRILGRTTARYRWFALLYLFTMFFVAPGFILALSLAGQVAFYCVIVPLAIIIFAIIIINVLQVKIPDRMPSWIKDWSFLPIWLRSFEPYDDIVLKILSTCCFCCPAFVEKLKQGREEFKTNDVEIDAKAQEPNTKGHSNLAFDVKDEKIYDV